MWTRSALSSAIVCAAAATLAAQSPRFGVGRPPTPDEVRGLGAAIAPDGGGLPEGSGSVAEGRTVFAARCASCHGPNGEGGGVGAALVGGHGTLATARPLKTVGSFWPQATTVWDYVNRAMPFDQPGLLKPQEVYAVVAYILNLNGIIADDAVMNASTLPAVHMPNRDGFVADPRPDVGRTKTTRPTPGANAQTLVGAIDFHAHGDPDGTARSIDVIDLAKAAKAAGMRAIVIKNHYEPTASLAYVVRKEVPGIEVFGGISLDLTVGGVNPAAVEWMTRVRGGFGKVIWLPTFDSEAQVKLDKQSRPFAPVTRDGKILPEVLQVIDLAAKHGLVLEMGHSAPRESLMIIAEAKRRGLNRLVVTHAMTNPGGPMSLEEMQQAAKLGALLELVYSPFTDEQLQKEADAIRTIGASSFVLASDLGQPQNPLHTDGLLAMYKRLMAKGISASDIDVMARRNPARLLGLER